MRYVKSFSALLGALFLATLFGCASGPDRVSTGQFIDDRVISTKVKAAFAEDPVVKALQVNVDTYNGNVQLSGFVQSPEEIRRAGELARRVEGVKSVQNDLRIRSASTGR